MTMKAIAIQPGEVYLFVDDADPDRGQIYESKTKTLYPPYNLQSILGQGYWEPYDGENPMVLQSNPWHDKATGRFAPKGGSGAGALAPKAGSGMHALIGEVAADVRGEVAADVRDELSKQLFNGEYTVDIVDRRAIANFSHRAFGRVLEDYEWGALVGAPDRATVSIRQYGDVVKFNVAHRHYDVCEKSMFFTTRDTGPEVTMYHSYIRAKSTAPAGFTTRSLAAEVVALRAMGVKEISLQAVGSPGDTRWNGYYTWPRLGFDGPLSFTVKQKLPPEWNRANTISDLLSKPNGPTWWKDHGEGGIRTFDLADGSASMRVHETYLKTKGVDVGKWFTGTRGTEFRLPSTRTPAASATAKPTSETSAASERRRGQGSMGSTGDRSAPLGRKLTTTPETVRTGEHFQKSDGSRIEIISGNRTRGTIRYRTIDGREHSGKMTDLVGTFRVRPSTKGRERLPGQYDVGTTIRFAPPKSQMPLRFRPGDQYVREGRRYQILGVDKESGNVRMRGVVAGEGQLELTPNNVVGLRRVQTIPVARTRGSVGIRRREPETSAGTEMRRSLRETLEKQRSGLIEEDSTAYRKPYGA